jgi:hypothetical protein
MEKILNGNMDYITTSILYGATIEMCGLESVFDSWIF